MKTMYHALIICLLSLFIAFPAQAQDTQSLRYLLQTIINQQKETLTPKIGATLLLDDEIHIEEAGTYYAITLPHIKALKDNGTLYDIGMISINAQPTQTLGRWTTTIALPPSIRVFDEADQELFTIKINRQSTTGQLDARLNGFMSFQGNYEDITITHTQSGYSFNIPTVNIAYDFTDNLVKLDVSGTSFAVPPDLIFSNDDRNDD